MNAQELICAALREDLGSTEPDLDLDITTTWTVPAGARATAVIVSRQDGVMAGMELAGHVFRQLDAETCFEACTADGGRVVAGATVARVYGSAAALLAAERTALNFLQRLSGISTLTRAYVDAVAATRCRITDTRKTTPGWRELEKYAVRLGGGVNHRMGLFDAVLIKENHAICAGGVDAAVVQARKAAMAAGRQVPVYAEAETLSEVRQLLSAGPDPIMLDNMPLETMTQAVSLIRRSLPETEIEATGGITLGNIRNIASTGVDLVSIGALTHSAPALDLSMRVSIQS